ncbi:type IX secretion system membrane protein PorP/SprF [Aurantibacter crassamenti]|uniref:PorP/SprF family type IX secretion system membrane protein n=1 Tax=Aurantibacter crassamenti TaxID=1837375 RepID=UPI00193AC5C1|nr:type IX secretion system membrane protein PorP/SprF [Aurantibacter crassamenti]MBM1107736.1 type IX secretion system membrane protein PorP/SprF [Aurantibacter crassamenti]
MKSIYKTIKLFLFCTVAMQINTVFAQQAPQYTQYMYNTSVLNPGYTGSVGQLEALLLHRSQWVNLDGAPEVQSFTVNGMLKERIGVGLSIVNDNIGASNNVDINANFAYHIQTGYNTKLGLGINAGLDVLKIDWSKGTFEDSMDPVFMENLNAVRPIFGAGAFFYSDKWYMGVSTNNFLNSKVYSDNDETVTDRASQYHFMAGYVFDLSQNLKFKPTVLAKYVSATPISFDISANFMIKEFLVLGAAYRFDDAFSAMAGVHVSKSFFLGYAYDYSINGLQSYNDGSHEIILKYNLFNQKKRALSPRFF